MLAPLEDIVGLLRHPGRPDERIALSRGRAGEPVASSATTSFATVQGQPVLVDFDTSVLRREDFEGGEIRPLLPRGKPSRLRRLAKSLFPSTGRSALNFELLLRELKIFAPSPLVVVVGGGARGEGSEPLYVDPEARVVAFDVYPSPQTSFVADGHAIPMADGSADGVVVQAVLEHVVDPFQIVAEIRRVLKPGGYVYAETPFLQHVHEGAFDFWRFTESGHRLLFRDFEPVARGALGGAGLSAYWALRALCRDLTRSRQLGAFLSGLFLPLVMIDRFLPEARRIDSANGVFFLGRRTRAMTGRLDPNLIYLGRQKAA